MINFVHNLRSVNESLISYKDGDLDDVRPCVKSDLADVDRIEYPSGEPGLIMNYYFDDYLQFWTLISTGSNDNRTKIETQFFGTNDRDDFGYRIFYKTEEDARNDFNRIAKILKSDPLFYLGNTRESQSAIKKLGFKKLY